MTITHNLIFATPEEASEFMDVAIAHWAHLKGTPYMHFTQHANVLIVNEKTFTKLDAGGILDSAR